MRKGNIFGEKATYGIIGCGTAARGHAEAILRDKESVLRAVFDVDQKRAKKFAAKYGCERKKNLSQLLNDKEIKAIIICTPHDTHTNLILKTLASRKFCITEKPLYLKERDRKALEKTVGSKKIIVVFQVRFHEPVRFLLQTVKKGMLGKIQLCSVIVRKNRDKDYFSDWHGIKKKVGGMLLNQGTHALDLMLEICGTPIKATGFIKNSRKFSEIEDMYIGQAKFSNGAIGNIEILTCGRDKNPENSILVIGSKGSIKVGGGIFDRIEYAHFDTERPRAFSKGKDDNGHPKFLSAVNGYILRGKKHPLLPFADSGLRASKFAKLLYQSAK